MAKGTKMIKNIKERMIMIMKDNDKEKDRDRDRDKDIDNKEIFELSRMIVKIVHIEVDIKDQEMMIENRAVELMINHLDIWKIVRDKNIKNIRNIKEVEVGKKVVIETSRIKQINIRMINIKVEEGIRDNIRLCKEGESLLMKEIGRETEEHQEDKTLNRIFNIESIRKRMIIEDKIVQDLRIRETIHINKDKDQNIMKINKPIKKIPNKHVNQDHQAETEDRIKDSAVNVKVQKKEEQRCKLNQIRNDFFEK